MSGLYPDITQTAMFAEAAAEARMESRRYWAKGGYADKKYPPQEPDFWPITEAADETLQQRRHRRQMRR